MPYPISLPAHDNAPKKETQQQKAAEPYDPDPLLAQEGKRETHKDLQKKTQKK